MASVGSIVHFSIPVTDMAAGTKFYGELFNWTFRQMSETYWLVNDGIGSLSLEKGIISGTMPILYFGVSSIDEGLRKASELGANTILKKTDAGDGKSFFATVRDPDGNVIGLWSKM